MGVRLQHAEAHRQFRSVLGLQPLNPACHGTQPFKIDYAGQPCRHCRTPVVRQTHAKPPKPGRSYFAWWFKCPGCKALYLVEAARRFFDATGTPEPSSAPAFSPDWVARDQAILPWQ